MQDFFLPSSAVGLQPTLDTVTAAGMPSSAVFTPGADLSFYPDWWFVELDGPPPVYQYICGIDLTALPPPLPDGGYPMQYGSYDMQIGDSTRAQFGGVGGAGTISATIRVYHGDEPVTNGAAGAYATVEELARVLHMTRAPTFEQGSAMQRVLDAAAFEIDAEMGTSYLGAAGTPALVVEVNVERAVEHWSQQESPFGVVGLGDAVPTQTARDSWNRHALKLAPLKKTWGVA